MLHALNIEKHGKPASVSGHTFSSCLHAVQLSMATGQVQMGGGLGELSQVRLSTV